MSNFPWNEQQVAELRTLTADGLSSGQIGARLGITRNAVVGKWHRLGIVVPGREPLSKSGKAARRRKARAKNARRDDAALLAGIWFAPSMSDGFKPEIVGSPIAFTDLQLHHCRWPVSGDGVAMLCCGADKVGALPYCMGHCRQAYTPVGRSLTREEIALRRQRFRKRAA